MVAEVVLAEIEEAMVMQEQFLNGYKVLLFWLLGEKQKEEKWNNKKWVFASNERLSHWRFGIYKELGFADGCGSGYHLGLLCLERSTMSFNFLLQNLHRRKCLC